MNWQLFTAFLLITLVLFLIPGPIVTLVIATSVSKGLRAGLDHRRRNILRHRRAAGGDRVGLELDPQSRALLVRDAALGRRPLSDLARHPGVARGRRRHAVAAERSRAVRARIAGRVVEPQDDRVLHGIPAAIRRSGPADCAPARRHVRGVGAAGGFERFGAGPFWRAWDVSGS